MTLKCSTGTLIPANILRITYKVYHYSEHIYNTILFIINILLLLSSAAFVHFCRYVFGIFTKRNCLLKAGLGCLGITCWPRNLRFAGPNSAEVDGFFSGRKNLEHKSGRDFKPSIPSLRFQAR